MGLIPRGAQGQTGYRRYTHADLHQVRMIRHAKAIGFSLAEIAALLDVRPPVAGDVGARLRDSSIGLSCRSLNCSAGVSRCWSC
jgi:DNA-binding transcriptional MerR regulator